MIRYYIASDLAPTTVQGVMAAMNANNFPAVGAPEFSTPEDIDSRTGGRRLLEDDYRLHADHVDTVRLALMDRARVVLSHAYVDDEQAVLYGSESARLRCGDWVDELWAIERACRALGIGD